LKKLVWASKNANFWFSDENKQTDKTTNSFKAMRKQSVKSSSD